MFCFCLIPRREIWRMKGVKSDSVNTKGREEEEAEVRDKGFYRGVI